MKVSIIIVTTNRFHNLQYCLDSINEFTDLSDKEIIIVSNACTDRTISYIKGKKEEGFPYKLLEFSKPISFSEAVNIGVLASEGEYLLFLREDAYVMVGTKKDSWVEYLMQPFNEDPTSGISGWFKTRNVYTKDEFVLFACCMTKRSIFNSLGKLIDISPFFEVTLCSKLKEKGYKIKQVPKEFPFPTDETILALHQSPIGFGGSSKVEFFDDHINKTYASADPVIRSTSIDNELYCVNKFSLAGRNPYCPEVQKVDNDKYRIKRYKFSLGNARNISSENVRRMLFTISFEEFIRQIHEIENILKVTNIKHRDIHPANVLFSEEDRCLKIIDFCYSSTDDIVPIENSPTTWSHNDLEAFQRLIKQIEDVFETIKKPLKFMESILSDMGKIYSDGSAPQSGLGYHEIDIPYFSNRAICKDVSKEFIDIVNNIPFKPKKVLDVGCSLGYNSFNMMRKFFLEKLYAYEADPYVFTFLQECKRIFSLDELELYRSIDYKTIIPKADIVICMNVHHWILFQLGVEKTGILMKNLISNCKEMFFQTSGAESGGHRIEEFRNKEDIQKYLYSVGGKDVIFISSSPAHGGLRHLFKVRGKL